MNRLFAALAMGGLLLGTAPGLAQNKDKEKEKPAEKPAVDQSKINKEGVSFKTCDGVLLKGTFYPSDKGGSSPAILMLPNLGSKRTDGDWEGLALRLQKKGYACLIFDWRGHGDSTQIVEPKVFWNYPYNQTYLKTYDPNKKNLSIKDFKVGYIPYLLNDIAAARYDLDNRNDNGQCNTSNIILIGAESGASLGFAWIMAEFYRPQIYKQGNLFQFGGAPVNQDPAGDDIAGAIWLSYRRHPGFTAASSTSIDVPYGFWLSWPGLTAVRDNVQMWFAQGSKDDKKGPADAQYMYKTILNAEKKKDKLPLTSMLPIEGTALRGVALLGKKELPTEDRIEQFIDKAVKMRPNQAQKKRNASEYKPIFIDPSGLGYR
jgi:pimeloyl-ACP methyl ester carboxylesterase